MSQSVDIQVVENIILLAKKHQVQSLELAMQDWRVRVDVHAKVHDDSVKTTTYSTNNATLSASTTMAAENQSEDTMSLGSQKQDMMTIVAPMVGTFYRQASPESPALVEIGQTVQVGDVVCIIEAMKMMHEVKAEQAGVVQSILLEDGAVVEYGQALFELSQS